MFERIQRRLSLPPSQEFIKEFLQCVLKGGDRAQAPSKNVSALWVLDYNLTSIWDEFTDLVEDTSLQSNHMMATEIFNSSF